MNLCQLNLLSKRQIKWVITPNFYDLLRKAELYYLSCTGWGKKTKKNKRTGPSLLFGTLEYKVEQAIPDRRKL
jgi:hypothetical protein